MDRAPVTEFGGIVGRVVHEAMSLGTLLTGVCLGIVLLAGAFFLIQFEMEAAANLFVPALVALAMARFALNGMWGEYSGTIFSTVGGTWPQAASVAGRYLTLNTVWILPVTILGIGFEKHAAAAASVMELVSSGQMVALVILYLTGAALAPPVFLIVSVRAEGYADLVRMEHWAGLFAGRLGDLYAVYTIYLGGLSMAILLSLPVLIVAFASSVNTGLFLSCVVLAFSGGLGITLLGRLCGFYAFGGEEQASASAPPPPAPGAAQRGPGPRPAPALARGPASGIALAQPGRAPVPGPGRAPGPPAPQVPRPAPLAARPASPPAAPPAGRPPAAAPAPKVAAGVAGRAAAAGSAAGAGPAGAAAVAAGATPSGKPPLMDAQRRVDEARQRFEQDHEAGIRLLEELREQYAPGPQVLHALVMARHLAGQTDKAVEAAREAFPLCFQRGNVVLAAEMFRILWKQLQVLKFNRDQILAIGGALVKMGDLKYATSTYAVVIRMDAGEKRAIKGLLQIADLNLQPGGAPDEAIKIYKYLLQNCPSSTFELDIRDRLADAERRLARAT